MGFQSDQRHECRCAGPLAVPRGARFVPTPGARVLHSGRVRAAGEWRGWDVHELPDERDDLPAHVRQWVHRLGFQLLQRGEFHLGDVCWRPVRRDSNTRERR